MQTPPCDAMLGPLGPLASGGQIHTKRPEARRRGWSTESFLKFARMGASSVRAIGEDGVQHVDPALAVPRDARGRRTGFAQTRSTEKSTLGQIHLPARSRIQPPHLVPFDAPYGGLGQARDNLRGAVS